MNVKLGAKDAFLESGEKVADLMENPEESLAEIAAILTINQASSKVQALVALVMIVLSLDNLISEIADDETYYEKIRTTTKSFVEILFVVAAAKGMDELKNVLGSTKAAKNLINKVTDDNGNLYGLDYVKFTFKSISEKISIIGKHLDDTAKPVLENYKNTAGIDIDVLYKAVEESTVKKKLTKLETEAFLKKLEKSTPKTENLTKWLAKERSLKYRNSTCNFDELYGYLEKIDKKYSKNFLETGEWPEKVLTPLEKKHLAMQYAHNPMLTPKEKEAILSMPKGERPDPSKYLSKEYIDANLAMFEDGVSVIQVKSKYLRYTYGKDFVGVKDDNSLFVMPKYVCDEVLEQAKIDPDKDLVWENLELSKLDDALGFKRGYIEGEGGFVRIDVDDTSGLDLRIPSGNEYGANEYWLPGGYTSGGNPEAVSNRIKIKEDNGKENAIFTKFNMD